jgi:predicted nuclease with TOPRIM domain
LPRLRRNLSDEVNRLGGKVDRLDGEVGRLGDEVGRLGGEVNRLDGHVDRLGGEVKRLAGDVATVVAKVDANAPRLDRFEHTFASKVEIENLRDLVQRSAEGFGATLARIERGVTELHREWQPKWEDHDRALRGHARRITRLESE